MWAVAPNEKKIIIFMIIANFVIGLCAVKFARKQTRIELNYYYYYYYYYAYHYLIPVTIIIPMLENCRKLSREQDDLSLKFRGHHSTRIIDSEIVFSLMTSVECCSQ
jgi:hypothetical protein